MQRTCDAFDHPRESVHNVVLVFVNDASLRNEHNE